MNVHKTVKTRVSKTSRVGKDSAARSPENMSSTMAIPLVPIVEELDVKNSAHLDIMLPGQAPRRVELGKGDITIGRDEDCSIQIPSTSVSRKHACLSAKGEDFMVEDLNSTNGMMVNGVRVSRCVLRNHDQIRIGEARIQFIQQRFRV